MKDPFPICRLPDLLQCNSAWTFRKSKAGRYGQIERIQCADGRLRQCVSLERVAAYEERTFSEEELDRALNKVDGRSQRPGPKSRSRHVDFGLQQAVATVRDLQWYEALREAGYDLTNVKVVPFLEKPISLDSQELFTRSQVRELIDNALGDRDSEWKDWLRDPVARAEHRSGPPKQWSGK